MRFGKTKSESAALDRMEKEEPVDIKREKHKRAHKEDRKEGNRKVG